MEKTIGRQSLPDTDSIEELARFWDCHDLTDFDELLQEASDPVFVPAKATSLSINLPLSDARHLKRIARSKGLKETTLLRQWVLERIHEASQTARRRSSKALPSTGRKTRGD